MSIVNYATEFCDKGELSVNEPTLDFLKKTVDAFISEEVRETTDAISQCAAAGCGVHNIEKVLDGFGDVAYLAINGIYKTFRMVGKDHETADALTFVVMRRICEANLAKIAGGVKTNELGKIMKPHGWQEPRYNDLLTMYALPDAPEPKTTITLGYPAYNFAEN